MTILTLSTWLSSQIRPASSPRCARAFPNDPLTKDCDKTSAVAGPHTLRGTSIWAETDVGLAKFHPQTMKERVIGLWVDSRRAVPGDLRKCASRVLGGSKDSWSLLRRNDGSGNGESLDEFRGKWSRLNSLGVVGNTYGTNAGFGSLHSQDTALRKTMPDDKTFVPKPSDARFSQQFITANGRQEKLYLHFDKRNGNNTVLFEESRQWPAGIFQ